MAPNVRTSILLPMYPRQGVRVLVITLSQRLIYSENQNCVEKKSRTSKDPVHPELGKGGGAVTPIFARLPRYINIPEKKVPSLSITDVPQHTLRYPGFKGGEATVGTLYVIVGMRDFSSSLRARMGGRIDSRHLLCVV